MSLLPTSLWLQLSPLLPLTFLSRPIRLSLAKSVYQVM